MTWDELTDQVLEHVVNTFDATDAIYYPQGMSEFPIRGAMGKAFIELDTGLAAPTSSTRPICLVKLADLPRKPMPGDRLEVHQILYRIINSQPDGEGGLTLILDTIDEP